MSLESMIRSHLKSSDFVQRLYRRRLEPYLPVLEPELYLIDKLRFRVALDIGSNVGVYAVRLSKVSKAVWCFEPIKYPRHILTALRLPNVHILPVAMGDRVGSVEIHQPQINGRTEHPLASIRRESFDRDTPVITETVTLKCLDDLSSEVPFAEVDFIKIDVEGFESNVLDGMSGFLSQYRPIFLIEIEERHNSDFQLVFERMIGLGYRPYYTDNGVSLRQMEPSQLEAFQAPQNFRMDVESRRKFRRGEKKSYINNFFFLQPNSKLMNLSF
jgi:FkbM family methyltransferase